MTPADHARVWRDIEHGRMEAGRQAVSAGDLHWASVCGEQEHFAFIIAQAYKAEAEKDTSDR